MKNLKTSPWEEFQLYVNREECLWHHPCFLYECKDRESHLYVPSTRSSEKPQTDREVIRVSNFGVFVVEETKEAMLDHSRYGLKLAIVKFGKPTVFLEVKSLKELENAYFWYDNLGCAHDYRVEPDCEPLLVSCILHQCEIGVATPTTYHYTGKITGTENFVWDAHERLEALDVCQPPLLGEREAYEMVWNDIGGILPHSQSLTMLMHSLQSSYISSLEELGCRRLETTLYICGETGTGKTGMVQYILGWPECTQAHISFQSTLASITECMKSRRDRPFILDDARPPLSRADANEQRIRVERVTRSAGDKGSGYGKMQYGQLDLPIFQASSVITGEQIVAAVKSTAGRMIFMHIHKGDVNFERLARASDYNGVLPGETSGKERYNLFLKCFIRRFVCKTEEIGRFNQLYMKHRETFKIQYAQNENIHGRMVDAAAFYLATYDVFAYYGKFLGATAPLEYRKQYLADLDMLIQKQHSLYSAASTMSQILTVIRELIENGDVAIVPCQASSTGDYVHRKHKHIIGYHRDGKELFLLGSVIAEAVNAYMKKNFVDGYIRLSGKAIRKMMWNEGFVDASQHNANRLTVQKVLNGARQRVTSVYYQKLKGDLLPEIGG